MNLALFFTYKTSLADWERNGSLDREINIYKRLATHFKTVYFVTYGHDDMRFFNRLPRNISILPKKFALPNILYSLFIPLLYRKELQSCDWLKTNQMLGSWSAVITKILFKKKLLLRTGYTESLSFVGKNVIKHWVIRLIEVLAYRNATVSIVTSEYQKKYIETTLSAKNIHVIPNGIDTNLFRPAPKQPQSEKTKLLFIGRLHPEKNLLNLLDALEKIPVKLLIIGKGSLEPDIRKRAKDLGVDLEIIPSVPNSKLPTIYNATNIYIQPSLYEGNPKTILEAMSCGLPVIASNVRGINTVIRHSETGFLCTTDSASIRHAIDTLIKDATLRELLGANARKTIEAKYAMMNSLRQELRIYESD